MCFRDPGCTIRERRRRRRGQTFRTTFRTWGSKFIKKVSTIHMYHIYITLALAWHYASSALLSASKSCSKLSVCLSNHSLVGLPVLPNKGSEDHTVFLRYQYRVRCTSVSNMSNLCTSMPNASPSILAILQSFSNCLSVTVYWTLSPMVAPVGRGGSIAITTVLV